MVRNYVSKNEVLMRKIFQSLREGKSLYQECNSVNISTGEFYNVLEKNEGFRERYLCSLADYADRCVDDIRKIVEELKEGKIDNSTAKLLIETMKWLVGKTQTDANNVCGEKDLDGGDGISEIVVKFI